MSASGSGPGHAGINSAIPGVGLNQMYRSSMVFWLINVTFIILTKENLLHLSKEYPICASIIHHPNRVNSDLRLVLQVQFLRG